MKKSHRTLMLAVLVLSALGGALGAQDRDRNGEVRGIFVRLAEREVDGRGYMGIVVKPFERDDHVTVLVPENFEALHHWVQNLNEGEPVEVSFVAKDGQRWINGLEVELRQEEGERGPEGVKRVKILRLERERPDPVDEQREGERRMEVRWEMRRPAERDRMDERREAERRIRVRREGERDPDGQREEWLRREPSPREQLDRQLREVLTGHMERLGMALKEVLAVHIERMQAEIRELRAHAENMQREVEELRAENERLRRQLRETNNPRREADREVRERGEPDRRRDDGQREERDMNRDGERDERREPDRSGDGQGR